MVKDIWRVTPGTFGTIETIGTSEIALNDLTGWNVLSSGKFERLEVQLRAG
jgi:hypothetical protein